MYADGAIAYVVYKARWLVLFSFCLLSMVNAWIWITWSPLVDVSTRLFGASEAQIDALSGIYFYIYVPFSFLSLQLLKRNGLRFGLQAAATLNLVGSFIRWYAVLRGSRSYRTVYIGTVFCALAQTFTLSMPPMLSGHWFPDHERGMATAIGVLSNSVGTAVGLGASIFLQFPTMPIGNNALEGNLGALEDCSTVFRVYLFLQLLISMAASLSMNWFVTSDYPPTPPSRAAWEQQKLSYNTGGFADSIEADGLAITSPAPNECSALLSSTPQPPSCEQDQNYRAYWNSLQMFLTDLSGLSFTVAYGLAVSCYYSIPPFLSQLLFCVASFDHPATTSIALGWLGILYIIGAILGSFAAGYALDAATITARTIFGTLLIFSTFSVLSLSCLSSTNMITAATTSLFILTTCIVSMTGFFLGSLITAGFEYGTAMSYPADEAAVAGVLECSAELFGFLQVSFGGAFSNYNKGTMNLHYTTMLVGCLLLSGTIFVIFVRADSKRPLSSLSSDD